MTSWGYFQNPQDDGNVLDIGSELSKRIDCPVHYPAFGKRLFECKCGVVFPTFAVEGAKQTGNWEMIIKQHKEGWRPNEEYQTAH